MTPSPTPPIRPDDLVTDRLVLRLMDPQFMRLCLLAEHQLAAEQLNSPVHDAWLSQWRLIASRLKAVQEDPSYQPWGMRAILLKHSGQMIGHTGFHTRPDPVYLADIGTGGIELGYEIYPDWRRQHLGKEAVLAMLRYAKSIGAQRFILSIAPDNQASRRLAASCGFRQFGERLYPQEDMEWLFRLEARQLTETDVDTRLR